MIYGIDLSRLYILYNSMVILLFITMPSNAQTVMDSDGNA